ncbi:hypothetical protein K2Z84_05380 [Candidatus Binatia bacterium]|nr:hypothetical protein [Candidatus Binatia bacterium]
MGVNRTRKTLCTAKIEGGGYGVDATPTASANTMLLFDDGNIVQRDVKTIEKKPLRVSLTGQKDGIGRSIANVNLSTVLMSRGDDTAAPWLDPLLRMSGLAVATGTEDTSKKFWRYTPRSSGFESATIYAYMDGFLWKVPGCYGTFTLDMQAGQMPDLKFEAAGLYVKPTNQAFPSATYPTDTKLQVESEQLVIGPDGVGYSPVVRSINLVWGMARAERGDCNSPKGFKGFDPNDRMPKLTLKVEVEDTLSNKDFFAYLDDQQALGDAAMDDVEWQHGDDVQSAIVFKCNAPQLLSHPFEEQDGLRLYTLTYKLRNNTDDGEFSMTFREEES